MPAFLANFLEPRFARPATVAEVIACAPKLRQVRFEGEALRGVGFRPGQEVELRVSERAFRHYTPAAFDARAGTMEIVFFLHGNGPGSDWAANLRPRQRVNVLGPGGSLGLREAARHVVLGDETALGLFACFAKAAPGRCSGAVEVEPGATSSPAAIGLDLPAVERGSLRGQALVSWLEAARLSPQDDVCFYLAGHTGSIVLIRNWLARRGWPHRNIRTKAYWAEGKRGL